MATFMTLREFVLVNFATVHNLTPREATALPTLCKVLEKKGLNAENVLQMAMLPQNADIASELIDAMRKGLKEAGL